MKQLQLSLQNIEMNALSPVDQKRLTTLRRATDDLVNNGIAVPVDQVCMQVARPFRQALQLKNPQLTQRFLKHLPVYFAEMEQQWQPLRSDKTRAVIREAEEAFDTLGRLEEQSPDNTQDLFQTARMALKDYIGLCQSNLIATE